MKILPVVLLLAILAALGCRKSLAEEAPDFSYHHGRIGASANDLLSDSNYRSLTVEIQYMTGFRPDSAALVNLYYFLAEHLHKPQGIRVLTKAIAPEKDTLSSLGEVAAIERANRTRYNRGDELAIYILYTNGVYVEPNLLGYAYRNTSAVLFGKNIWENANRKGRPSRSDLETKVLQHEVAHLMGLVNVGTALQSDHKDNDHGKHCRNRNCLMYYLTETEESPSFLMKKPLPRLDEACRADLRANGGK
ncbi:hypothetical protein [Flaviaesturariibacter aridisoli]|uniref:Peptidase n=1 Tax=Flaviaesturariibacter aridisoli TaxID=2545761 RepID=A0A4R4DVB8_9BACT|nr:hypothetical protein [Flaviaesturariibacter aridisoli]TCZ66303.1 hypothetical protein E0486_16930 [Flaviaesturariibacter aridisoli]